MFYGKVSIANLIRKQLLNVILALHTKYSLKNFSAF